MSFLQLDLPADQVADKTVRRALIDAILERTPTVRDVVSVRPARPARSAKRSASKSSRMALRRKCCTRSEFHWNGRSGAKMLRTLVTTVRVMRSPRVSTAYSTKAASRTLRKRSANLARTAEATISANANKFAYRTMIARAALLKYSASAMRAWDFCRARSATPAVLGNHFWRTRAVTDYVSSE